MNFIKAVSPSSKPLTGRFSHHQDKLQSTKISNGLTLDSASGATDHAADGISSL
jgi:hypothetical protein